MRKVGAVILGEQRKEDVVINDFTELTMYGDSKIMRLAMSQIAEVCLWPFLVITNIVALIGATRAYKSLNGNKKAALMVCYTILLTKGKEIPDELKQKIREIDSSL